VMADGYQLLSPPAHPIRAVDSSPAFLYSAITPERRWSDDKFR
jgi:hypothetical protein